MKKKVYIIPTIKTALMAEYLMELVISNTQGDGNQLSKEVEFDEEEEAPTVNVWDE